MGEESGTLRQSIESREERRQRTEAVTGRVTSLAAEKERAGGTTVGELMLAEEKKRREQKSRGEFIMSALHPQVA